MVNCAVSPGVPDSLKRSVSDARSSIWPTMFSLSTAPCNSSITGITVTIIPEMIEITPANNKTVAIAAETASSSWSLRIIESQPVAG